MAARGNIPGNQRARQDVMLGFIGNLPRRALRLLQANANRPARQAEILIDHGWQAPGGPGVPGSTMFASVFDALEWLEDGADGAVRWMWENKKGIGEAAAAGMWVKGKIWDSTTSAGTASKENRKRSNATTSSVSTSEPAAKKSRAELLEKEIAKVKGKAGTVRDAKAALMRDLRSSGLASAVAGRRLKGPRHASFSEDARIYVKNRSTFLGGNALWEQTATNNGTDQVFSVFNLAVAEQGLKEVNRTGDRVNLRAIWIDVMFQYVPVANNAAWNDTCPNQEWMIYIVQDTRHTSGEFKTLQSLNTDDQNWVKNTHHLTLLNAQGQNEKRWKVLKQHKASFVRQGGGSAANTGLSRYRHHVSLRYTFGPKGLDLWYPPTEAGSNLTDACMGDALYCVVKPTETAETGGAAENGNQYLSVGYWGYKATYGCTFYDYQ